MHTPLPLTIHSNRSKLGAADSLLLGTSLDWADDKYTHAFFGVDPVQSVRSGLATYTAGAGIKSYSVNAAWVHAFSPAWSSMLGVHAKRLAGDAADSPITEEPSSIGVSAFVACRI